MLWLAVGLGGALGSMARHGLNVVLQQRVAPGMWPLGTLAVNVLGSMAMGAVGALLASGRWSPSLELRTFVAVGLLGGFTTFSAFSFETLALARDGHVSQAAWNVVGQVVLSLVGAWIGYRLASLA